MGVVRTDKWLSAYIYKWNKARTIEEKVECQREVIIQPLNDLFSTTDILGLHQYLLQLGLFHPEQTIDIEYEKWQKKVPWLIVQKQFNKLKNKWNGPDVKIYILPLTDQNRFLEVELGAKTGLTIEKGILLFIRSYTTTEDLLALITHEYHHACRLAATKQTEDEMVLLESMVMEGLAEKAVEEEMGALACATWTSRYDNSWNVDWYNHWIKPNLRVRGRQKHLPYLYGSEMHGIPLWLGYYIGYKMVNSATSHTDTTNNLLHIPAETILERSNFRR
ncbi:DUF2268 domain-containing protein [Halalkalibacter alkalisediminis]|uniref:DUF2268 domain-containing protein n=1 Tax=Halalkalibacter alkalisediminis TaxID=935616 RepID=A0ABV6NA90_9BACI|nr:DUF2268 domain-containing putative Zn-dependent protease [Halalkalibacter alkalisediminis]